MNKLGITLAVAVLFASPLPASAQGPAVVGRIKSASGSVTIVRPGGTVAAGAGQPLYQSDSVRTGADGQVGITLKDETRLALGPNTDVRYRSVLYCRAGTTAMVMKIARVSRLCIRQDRQAGSRCRPPGNPVRHTGSARHANGDSRRSAVTSSGARLLIACAAAGVLLSVGCGGKRVNTAASPQLQVVLLEDPENPSAATVTSKAGTVALTSRMTRPPWSPPCALRTVKMDEPVGANSALSSPTSPAGAALQPVLQDRHSELTPESHAILPDILAAVASEGPMSP